MAIHYLGRAEFAARVGISPNTLSSYWAKGLLPEPDAIVGEGPRAIRGWLPETIDTWNAARPGRGARTDLQG